MSELTLVLARAINGVIGKDGGLPWHIPADLKRFKALTMGRPMIMGRKTFESLPGVLPGRRHIVLTRDTQWRHEGVEIAPTIDDAIAMAGEAASVIGGAEVFRLFEPLAARIELTEVLAEVEGDVEMADLRVGDDWREVASEDHQAEGDTPAYRYVTLVRNVG